MLVNLISNSLKFTRNGIITLGARVAEAGLVEVYVRDTGTGMPRNETDEAVSMGTGLGLHICREIVAAHGGELMTHSKPGEGTAVWFSIKIVDGDETNE